jgi:hypothetical protein
MWVVMLESRMRVTHGLASRSLIAALGAPPMVNVRWRYGKGSTRRIGEPHGRLGGGGNVSL